MFELTIQRSFNTPVAKLFEAWCKPEIIQKWFAPGSMTVPEAISDLKEGGKYRIVMHDGDEGTDHIVGGEYQNIIKDKFLKFTWQWEGNPMVTQVAIKFNALDDNKSELELSHSEFAEQEACDKHEMGWNGCLANLSKITD
mgnify:FL=1